MNYLAVYNYFKDVSQNLGVTVKWFHGRRSIQNLTKFEGGFYFFSNPFTSSGSLTDGTRQVNDTWTASITIAMQDQADGDIDQNNEDEIQPSIRAITLCENIAEKYIHYLNENTINDSLSSSAQEINVVSVSKSPVFRDTAYMLSGITLDISFTVMDDFDYCCDPVTGFNPSPITNFVYSNNGQSVESGGFVTMVPTVTPTDGTYTYFLNPSDTLPTGLSLNGATGNITRSGTIPNGSYAFNVIVVGSGSASGIATVEVTLTITGVEAPLFLNSYPDAAFAYSFKRLSNTYNSYGVRIRRADNVERDIEFSGNELDEADAEFFIGSSNAFTSLWYDQSGNARNILNTTTTLQPKFATSGVIEKTGGNIGIQFDGSDDYLQRSDDFSANTIGTFFFVLKNDRVDTNGYIFSTLSQLARPEIFNNNGNIRAQDGLNLITSGTPITTNLELWSIVINGANSKIYRNGTLLITGDAGSLTFFNVSYRIGTRANNTLAWQGKMVASIFYLSDKSADIDDMNAALNTLYSIY